MLGKQTFMIVSMGKRLLAHKLEILVKPLEFQRLCFV